MKKARRNAIMATITVNVTMLLSGLNSGAAVALSTTANIDNINKGTTNLFRKRIDYPILLFASLQ